MNRHRGNDFGFWLVCSEPTGANAIGAGSCTGAGFGKQHHARQHERQRAACEATAHIRQI